MKPYLFYTGIAAAFLLLSCGNNSLTDKDSHATEKNETKAVAVTVPHPQIPVAKGAPRILFVGNSHTEYYVSMPVMFEEFCKFNNQAINTDVLISMGVDILTIYANNKTEAEADFAKKDPDGNYYDFVVLQEQTPVAFQELEKYKADVKLITDKITVNSPGVAIYIFESMCYMPFTEDKQQFTDCSSQMKSNAMEVVKQTSNAGLFRIGDAVKDAYEGKEGYSFQAGGTDKLRFGEPEGTLHLINEGGFLEAALLYATIFNKMPAIPEQLTLSTGTGENDGVKKMPVAQAISNAKALAAIAFNNR